ncbi:MAG: type II secretion system F family protein [Chloroflexi bacterium]|nr:MAG: type II secretion system F family protein [Chloroflexota bacterium]
MELALGGLMFFAVLLLVIGYNAGQALDPVQARLQQIAAKPRNLEELELQRPMSERTLKPLLRAMAGLVSRFYPANTARSLELKLKKAGMETTSTESFLGIKGVVAIVVGLLASLLVNAVTLDSTLTAVAVPIGLIVGFLFPDLYLSNRASGRNNTILKTLADALDLLTISVEAGLAFDAGVQRVTEKLKGPLSDEFKRASQEMRIGKSRAEALRGIIERTDCKELANFISAVIQADQLGVSMSKVLRVQSETLRVERRQRAEEKAAKTPVLIMLPTVGCIFPSLFIVILAPAALTAMKSCGSV